MSPVRGECHCKNCALAALISNGVEVLVVRQRKVGMFHHAGQGILNLDQPLLISVLLPTLDVVAIPAAFAISSTLETLTLAGVLFLKLRGKSQEQQAATNFAMER